MNKIMNIGKYRIISLGKKYEDGEFHTIDFQRRNFGFDVFRTGMYIADGQEYIGHKNFGDTFSYIMGAYDVGYKTIHKEVL
jgi:hypothetical protein